MAQVSSFTTTGATWVAQKIIDAISGVPTHMCIGAGDGTVAFPGFTPADMAEFSTQPRVTTTRSNPAAGQTQWAGTFTLTAVRNIGAFGICLSSAFNTNDYVAVTTIDRIDNVPNGTVITVTMRTEQRAA